MVESGEEPLWATGVKSEWTEEVDKQGDSRWGKAAAWAIGDKLMDAIGGGEVGLSVQANMAQISTQG